MHEPAFFAPVTVLVGLGFPRRISGAREALAYLDEVPMHQRDDLHAAADHACREALAGRRASGEAHKRFCDYLRPRGVLVEGRLATAAMAAREDLFSR